MKRIIGQLLLFGVGALIPQIVIGAVCGDLVWMGLSSACAILFLTGWTALETIR